MLETVRSFNRVVTQSIGVLQDHYLSRSLPLGQARVLWEVGDGCDVRELRARLDLDSGYLSRLVRSLETAGLVTVRPSSEDRRVRSVQLTAAGRRERAVLDRRSDDLARSLLAPLSDAQRARLVAAMAEVERLLSAGLVRVEIVDPEQPAAAYCLGEYYAELGRRFEDGWDHAISIAATPEQLRPPAGLFVVATLHGAPVGCGALKFHGRSPAELKRMWVAPTARGLGLGRRLLTELERLASDHGVRALRLETNRSLIEAIALYRSAGYREVQAFNDEPYAHHWFEKRLPRRADSAAAGVRSARTPAAAQHDPR
jgi:DNA-binding MarR family transcriptional regulator/N-acetylglutamate synthase-like GNAT family acetyltransferase